MTSELQLAQHTLQCVDLRRQRADRRQVHDDVRRGHNRQQPARWQLDLQKLSDPLHL